MERAGRRVLVIEDDVGVRDVVVACLAETGYSVDQAADGREARALTGSSRYHAVLLDLGLPDEAGLDLLVDLTCDGEVPVIVLSGRGGETDRVVGLELGADDYIAKPFSERELVARVDAVVRRATHGVATNRRVFGTLTLDTGSREVSVDGSPIELSAKEFDMLCVLTGAPRQVFSRRQLLEQVWASSPDWQDDSTVSEHVYRLRAKISPQRRFEWIQTVRNVGYRFVPSDRTSG